MTEVHSCSYYCDRPECIKAQRDELRERLAQPEQEPVAWIDEFGNVFPLGAQRGPKHLNEPMKPLYTAPPQRKPSHAEFEKWLRSKWTAGYGCPKVDGKYTDDSAQSFWECWQAAHGIKENT